MTSGIETIDAALRIWRRAPAVAGLATAAITLATTLLLCLTSILWGVFETDLPGMTDDDLFVVQLSAPDAEISKMPLSSGEYLAWSTAPDSPFAEIGAFIGTSTTWTAPGRPATRLNGAYATPSLLAMASAQPQLGQLFSEATEDATSVLLGHKVWMQHFGSDPQIVGHPIQLDGHPRTVVGVMPPGFRFPLNQDLWFPLQVLPDTSGRPSRLQVVARLHPGTSPDASSAHLSAQVQRLRSQDEHAWTVQIEPYLRAYTDPTLRRYVVFMAWAAFGVLLVAALNVSCLMAGRTASRLPEISVRRLLGARGVDLMGSAAGEAIGLALAGGLLGFALAWPIVHWLDGVLRTQLMSYWIHVHLDGRSVWLTILAIAVCVLLSSTLPIWMSLRHGSQHVSRARRPLTPFLRAALVIQIAITAGLLFPTSALIQSLGSLAAHRPALATDDVMRAQIALPWAGYRELAERHRFYDQFQDRMAAEGSWSSFALATSLPGDSPWRGPLEARGIEQTLPTDVAVLTVTAGLLDTFDVELAAGRSFDSRDTPDSEPVAWVSSHLATRLFGSPARALERQIRIQPEDPSSVWLRIVGVVPDHLVDADMPLTQTGTLHIIDRTQGDATAAVFRPLHQAPRLWLSLAVESSLPLEQVTEALRTELHRVDPSVPLFWQKSYGQMMTERTWDYRLFGSVFVALGLATLGMTVLGLLGVAALLMRERRRELAVRQAVGAGPAQILSRVLGYAFLTAACGLTLGHVLGRSSQGALESLLFGLEGLSPWHYIAVDGLFLWIIALAFGWPAQKVAYSATSEVLKGE